MAWVRAVGALAAVLVVGPAAVDPEERRTRAVQPALTSPAAEPLAAPEPEVDEFEMAGRAARRITDRTSSWASYTLLDRETGRRIGDDRSAEPTNSESTVKIWLAADLLATRGGSLSAYETSLVTSMIRVSDDDAAAVIWRSLGADASIGKMIATCRLTDTTVYPGWWSLTQISSRDLAKLGSCLVPGPGKFLSAKVGAPLTHLMRTVAKSDAFGIPQARLGGPVAVKNGWTEHGGTGLWNVNCLGLYGPDLRWSLAVTIRYPIDRGLGYGATICRRVAATTAPLAEG